MSATEIILVNFGLDKIIVSDNGEGITKADLESLGNTIEFWRLIF